MTQAKHKVPASYLELCDRAAKHSHRVMLDATAAAYTQGRVTKHGELRLLHVETQHGTRLAQTTVAGDLDAAARKIMSTYTP